MKDLQKKQKEKNLSFENKNLNVIAMSNKSKKQIIAGSLRVWS